MNLHSITLTNFKKHEHLDVQFAPTLNAIRGPNWAGKSTILQAIFFAFFGVTAVPGGSKKIQRRGSTEKAQVELYLTDGTEITRTLTTASVKIDDKTVASGHTAVNTWVEEHVFGMDQKRAMMLCYAPQSETAALLTLGAPALNRMIEELSGGDYVEQQIQKAIAKTKASKDKLSAISVVEPLVDACERVAALHNSHSTCVQTEKLARVAVEVLKAGHEEARTALREAGAHNQKLQERAVTETKLGELYIQLGTVEEKIQAAPEQDTAPLQLAVDEAAESSSIIVGAKQDLAQAEAQVTELKIWLADNMPEPKQTTKVNKALRTATTAKQKAEQTLAEITKKLEDTTAKLVEKLQAIKGAACGECKRPFDKQLLDTATAERLTLEAAQVELKEQQKTAKKVRDDAMVAFQSATEAVPSEKLLALVADKGERLVKAEETVKELKTWAAENLEGMTMDQAIEKYREQVRTANEVLVQARTKQETRKALLLDRTNLRGRETALKATLSGLPTGEILAVEGLQQEEEGKLAAFQAAQQALFEATACAQVASRDLQAAESALKQAEKVEEDRAKLESEVQRFGELAKWLAASKIRFLGEIWDGILAMASEFVAGATQGYASAVGRTDDGEFSVVEDGEDGPMVGASGGMKAICATGLRLGLDSLLPRSPGFLLLDEPSSELNNENAAGMAGALRMQEKQVILVTHREGEEFASDQVIEIA